MAGAGAANGASWRVSLYGESPDWQALVFADCNKLLAGAVVMAAAKALGVPEVAQRHLKLFVVSTAKAKPSAADCEAAITSTPIGHEEELSDSADRERLQLTDLAWLLLQVDASSAAVGAGPAASSAEAQAFLNDARAQGAQGNVRNRVVPGEILRFPQLNMTPCVYIRRCFQPLLWGVLSVHVLKAGSMGDVLSGTPGVGKSTLAVLAVYVALSEGRDVAFWNGQQKKGHVFCGDKATTFRDYPSFLHAAECLKTGSLYVYDTYDPPAFPGSQTLLVSSPKAAIWKEFMKFGNLCGLRVPKLWVFPTCSKEEIEGMAGAFGAADAPEWLRAYECVGGVPRHVFETFNEASFAAPPATILRDVENAFRSGIERTLGEAECKVPDMYVHFRTLGQASEAGQVDEAQACVDMLKPQYFTPYGVVYASPKAQEVVEKAAETLSEEQRVESLATALQNNALRGLASGRFERFVHERLAAGVKPDDGWQSREIGKPVGASGTAFSVSPARDTFVFSTNDLLTTGKEQLDRGFYLRPVAQNQAAIDAIIQGRKGLAQMTIASRHDISSSGLAQVLPLFPASSPPPPLYIFVPPEEYASHYRKPQPITGGEAAGLPALKQFVVSVPVRSRHNYGTMGAGAGGSSSSGEAGGSSSSGGAGGSSSSSGGGSLVSVGEKRGPEVPAEQAGPAGKKPRL